MLQSGRAQLLQASSDMTLVVNHQPTVNSDIAVKKRLKTKQSPLETRVEMK